MAKGEYIKPEDIRWPISEAARKIIDDYNDKLQSLEHENNFYEAFNQIRDGEQLNLSQTYCSGEQKKTLKTAQEIVNKRWIRGKDTTWIEKLEYTYEYYDERGVKHYLQLKLGTKYKELLKDLQKETYQANSQDLKNLPNQDQEGYLVDCQKCRKKYNLNCVPPRCHFCQSRQIQVWKNGLLQLLLPESHETDSRILSKKADNQINSPNLCYSCQKTIKPWETYWYNQEIPDQKTCNSCHQKQQEQQQKTKKEKIWQYISHGIVGALLIGLIIWGIVKLLKKKEKSKSPGFCINILTACIKSKLRIICKY